MTPFAYTAAPNLGAAIARRAAGGRRRVHRRWHRHAPAHAGERARARHADRPQRAAAVGHRRGWQWPAYRRADTARRCRERRARAAAISRNIGGAARHRLAAGAQHGDGRRQPAATHALPLFPRRRDAVQQARAGLRLPGAWTGRTASTQSSAAANTASRPTPAISPSRCWCSTRGGGRPARTASAACRSSDFYRLPGDTPHVETVLRPAKSLPPCCCRAKPLGQRSRYFKVRDRASFEWAIASAAVAIADKRRRGRGRRGSPSAGSRPSRGDCRRWSRCSPASASRPNCARKAAATAADGAIAHGANAYKVPLLKGTVERTLLMAGGLA